MALNWYRGRQYIPWVSPEIYCDLVVEECAGLGVAPWDALKGKRQTVPVLARWRAWRRLRQEGFPFYAIARASGYDHSTIVSAMQRLPEVEADFIPYIPPRIVKQGAAIAVSA